MPIYSPMYAYIHVHTPRCTYLSVFMHVYPLISHTYADRGIQMHMSMRKGNHIYVYIYVYEYAYINSYIHLDTHIFAFMR